MVQRIAIVGQPGSGKSTLARALGTRTGLPVFHMDHIHWKPNWQERDHAERLELAREVLTQEAWIFEGGFSKINAERVARADMLIWLDFPFLLRVWRVAKRTVWYFGRTRADMQDDCREGMNPEMVRFWVYIWRTRQSARQKIEQSLRETPAALEVRRLTSRTEVARLLQDFDSRA